MVRITEDLIRKRAEHNEGDISTLEEISLHQFDIERIELLDKCSKHLKILYLQSNLIPKIENVSRLKKLEYLNLALNNVERIENLEGCESLQKLDLTINFVGELTSIECLKDLVHFREIFLTGNPCTEYEGYKEFVIATLPQLKRLDGIEIEKSERILAIQDYDQLRKKILIQQEEHKRKRKREREDERLKEEREKRGQKPGFDGRWYTDIQPESTVTITELEDGEDEDDEDDEEEFQKKNKEFWDEKVAFTPESRVKVHEQMKKVREREDGKKNKAEPKKERKLQSEDGRMFNVNEAKVDFSLVDDEENNKIILDVAVFRHMDTSLCDVDIQTTYVRVYLKGKLLQLTLPEEVNPDSSTAERSQTTGHLVLTMPKNKPHVKPVSIPKPQKTNTDKENESKNTKNAKGHERLEVGEGRPAGLDIGNIVQDKPHRTPQPLGSNAGSRKVEERPNSHDFVDDPDVPPLI